jgi:hypothetical protein
MLTPIHRRALLGSFFVIGLVAACGGGNGASGGATPSATIGPSGGVVEEEGIRLTIPAGALTEDVTISVAAAPEIAPSDGYAALSSVFLFTPDGLVFRTPAVVEIAFRGDGAGAAVVWSSATAGVEELASTASAGSMTASVLHFSRGFVGRRDRDAAPPDAGPGDASPPADAPYDVADAPSDGPSCQPLSGACDAGSQCCSGACGGGTCVPGSSTCTGPGAGCDAGTQCCSGLCTSGGICS